MISRYREFINPICDNCGYMMGSEETDDLAREAMGADGWEVRDGKDICKLCLRHEREDGKLPKRPRFNLKGLV